MKAAMVLGDPWRLETVSRLFGSDGLPLPLPPQEYVLSVVRLAITSLSRPAQIGDLPSVLIVSICWKTPSPSHSGIPSEPGSEI